MFVLYQLAYAMVAGFVAAGLTSSVYVIVAGRKPSLAQVVETNWQGLHIVFLSIFAGPWILASAVLKHRVERRISTRLFITGLALAGLWGLCFGIVVIKIFENIAPALAG